MNKKFLMLGITKGQHIRPDKYPYFIARSFFHSVGDIKKEVSESGLNLEKILSIEGPSWIVPKFKEKWNNKDSRNRLLNLAKICEEDENIVAMSPHIMSIARKNI